METKNETCEKRKFYLFVRNIIPKESNPHNLPYAIGYCRRYPPHFESENNTNDINLLKNFPIVGENGWCGEYKSSQYEDNLTLDDLELSRRARNCLRDSKIESIERLCNCTETNLLCIKGFGRTCLKEVERKLKKRGLALKGQRKWDPEPNNGF